jgi:hypothetical protein
MYRMVSRAIAANGLELIFMPMTLATHVANVVKPSCDHFQAVCKSDVGLAISWVREGDV